MHHQEHVNKRSNMLSQRTRTERIQIDECNVHELVPNKKLYIAVFFAHSVYSGRAGSKDILRRPLPLDLDSKGFIPNQSENKHQHDIFTVKNESLQDGVGDYRFLQVCFHVSLTTLLF